MQQASSAFLTLHVPIAPACKAPLPYRFERSRSEKLLVSIDHLWLARLVWHGDNQPPRGDAQQVVQHAIHLLFREVLKYVQDRHRVEVFSHAYISRKQIGLREIHVCQAML